MRISDWSSDVCSSDLCVQVANMPKSMPIAVLEAKREGYDPLKGMQQAKAYADCERFEVKYVFATNGHRYGEFDCFTSLQDGPFPFADFLTHRELTVRYAKDRGFNLRRSEERRVGKEWVSTGRSRWWRYT